MSHADRAVDALAARQHGCLAAWQLHSLGVPESLHDYRVREGRWIVLARGVWALASSCDTWHRQLMAAVLTHPRAVLFGPAAAALHRLPGYDRRPPEIVVPWTASARSPLAIVHRSQHLSGMGTQAVHGIRTLDPAETIFSIAHRTSPAHLERVTDHALLSGAITVEELREIHDRYLGERFKGIRKMRRLISERLAECDPPARSMLEQRLRSILLGAAIPPIRFGFRMAVGDQVLELDAWIPSWRIDIEADGRLWHARAESFDRDRRRDNILTSHGIRVLRFTADDLFQRPSEVVERIQQAGRSPLDVQNGATIAPVGTSNV